MFCPQDDLNLSGYRKYLTSQAAPLPLTAAEEELRQIKLNEVIKWTRTQSNASNWFESNVFGHCTVHLLLQITQFSTLGQTGTAVC